MATHVYSFVATGENAVITVALAKSISTRFVLTLNRSRRFAASLSGKRSRSVRSPAIKHSCVVTHAKASVESASEVEQL